MVRWLSALLTAACALFLAGLSILVVSLHAGGPALDSLQEPERALALVVERTMELREALARAPAWERRFYELGMTDGTAELRQAITWYEELARESVHPEVDLRLAMLHGEAGHLAEVRETVARWPARGPPFDVYAALIAAAFLDGPVPAAGDALRELTVIAPEGWFGTRLAERLASRTSDTAWREVLRASTTSRMQQMLLRVRAITLAELALLAGGLVAVAALLTRGPPGVVVAYGDVPPPWALGAGLTVIVRGAAAGALVGLGLLYGLDSPLADALAVPLINLPIVLLAGRQLTPPPAPALVSTLGLRPRRGGWWPLVLTAVTLVAAGLVIDLAVGMAGESLAVTSDWTEWFDADLAWGPPAVVAAALASIVLFAPIFEEIVFRGLLFGTLRNAFGWPLAAALSAVVFALAHGYGSLGFASVFLSGVLWAYAYEATGSLLPGIVAHAVNNIIASAGVLLLLRV